MPKHNWSKSEQSKEGIPYCFECGDTLVASNEDEECSEDSHEDYSGVLEDPYIDPEDHYWRRSGRVHSDHSELLVAGAHKVSLDRELTVTNAGSYG